MDAAQGRLDGKIAVVTGGTQGLGEAIARLFADRGAAGIVICGRNAEQLFERMMAVNLRAPFFLMQDAAKIMRREKIAGTIVNIQSMSALGGQSFLTPYGVSKGPLATLTKNAAKSAAEQPFGRLIDPNEAARSRSWRARSPA